MIVGVGAIEVWVNAGVDGLQATHSTMVITVPLSSLSPVFAKFRIRIDINHDKPEQ